MRDENRKTKPKRTHPMFYVCLVVGIVAFSFIIDLGDSIVAAGLECGIGAICGIALFYIMAALFGWTLYK
jgi:hypothetical protein